MRRAEWRVLIADDEPLARRGVRQLLAPYPEFQVVGESRHGGEVLRSLDALKPDVIFLDIQMPEVDGFELVRRRRPDRMPTVVFLTAWEQFALRAFEAQAFDYLVKPVSEARFAATIKRLRAHLHRDRASPPAEPALTVSAAGREVRVRASEIDWVESSDNYVRIWVGERSYLQRLAMNEIESAVRSHGFLRVHRSALVRLDAVRELGPAGDGAMELTLHSGARIPVSRRRRAALKAALRRPLPEGSRRLA